MFKKCCRSLRDRASNEKPDGAAQRLRTGQLAATRMVLARAARVGGDGFFSHGLNTDETRIFFDANFTN
jgi:hypothetical protein